MIKPLEKIRELLVGERYVTEVCNKIVKNKKLTKTEKLNLILNSYSDFYNSGKFDSNVEFVTYQEYYEYFMLDGQEHLARYNNVKRRVEEEKNYLITVVLTKQIETLDLNISDCAPKQVEIIKATQSLRKNLYTKNFPYERFYIDQELREKVVEASQDLISQLKAYNKKQQEIQAIMLWKWG